MRLAVVLALFLLSACASDKLALAPPPGVDLSGQWRLDVEDSDDPLHLIQSTTQDPSKATAGSQGGGGGQGGGQGGRGGRGGRGGGAGAGFPGGTMPPPATPAFSTLSEALGWPGRDVEVRQSGGVVTLTSGGVDEVYRPTAGISKGPLHHKPGDDAGPGGRERDMRARDRGPPPVCGWDEKTLVVQSRDADEDQPPFEKRYSVSEDGQRLYEIVGFQGGRYGGFTMSRVWNRVDSNAPPSPQPGAALGSH
jgi:hypothetical protein